MELIELDGVTESDRRQVFAGEREPWGGVAEALEWQEHKSHNIALRDDAGRLVGLAGLLIADLLVDGDPLQVVGIGGVIVTRAERGRGLARRLIERLLEIAGGIGPARAMLFCIPVNVGLYAKFRFELIEAPVRAHQPGGPVEVPLCAMWRPLTESAAWPEGPVELLGRPF